LAQFEGNPQYLLTFLFGRRNSQSLRFFFRSFILKMSSSFVRTLTLSCDESTLRSLLEKTSEECPTIGFKICQLPGFESSFEVTLSSSCETITNRAEAVLRFLLPANAIISRFPPNSKQSMERLAKYGSEKEFVKNSIDWVSKALNEYKPEELCISFNGGKDCTALLHIVYTVFVEKYPNNKLNAFYIEIPDSFPSLENFVRQTVRRYNLNLISHCTPDYKKALHYLKSETQIKAIFMGTRISDLPKNVALSEWQMTDANWPQFLRISPMLKWSYSQVWSFLRDNDVLYCSLYDRGYTSVGSTSNTTPNPLLKFMSRNGSTYYMPAYMLTNEEQERSGRT